LPSPPTLYSSGMILKIFIYSFSTISFELQHFDFSTSYKSKTYINAETISRKACDALWILIQQKNRK
jgi:hypothetical protein